MAVSTNGVDWQSAPQDYAALFTMYRPYVIAWCAKKGIDENNREDVANEIMLRCIERDILKSFDPNRVFEYQGELRPARFKSFFGRFVALSVQGHRDKQNRIKNRETQICDLVMSEDESGNKASWADLYGPPANDHADIIIEVMADEQEARRVRELLEKVPPRVLNDRCDLVELYDAVRYQLLNYGEYSIKDLQPQFPVGNTTLSQWVHWLKVNLAHIYGRPEPQRRARRVGQK